jgi:hypothetical protein
VCNLSPRLYASSEQLDIGYIGIHLVQEEAEFNFLVKFKDKNDKALNHLKLSEEIKDKMGGVLKNAENIFL